MNRDVYAPCGMNCAACIAFLRDRNKCNGCWSKEGYKSNSTRNCAIRNCKSLARTKSKFCFECDIYPCARLKKMDNRYKTRYNMSMLDNLSFIWEHGLREFDKKEQERWRCDNCGNTISVHRDGCMSCN